MDQGVLRTQAGVKMAAADDEMLFDMVCSRLMPRKVTSAVVAKLPHAIGQQACDHGCSWGKYAH